jgi:hypothetical protein
VTVLLVALPRLLYYLIGVLFMHIYSLTLTARRNTGNSAEETKKHARTKKMDPNMMEDAQK